MGIEAIEGCDGAPAMRIEHGRIKRAAAGTRMRSTIAGLLRTIAAALALGAAPAVAAAAPATPADRGSENGLQVAGEAAGGSENGLQVAGEAAGGSESAEGEEGELEPEQFALIQTAPSASATTIVPSDDGHATYRLISATYFDA